MTKALKYVYFFGAEKAAKERRDMIYRIYAGENPDSRGEPTVEDEVFLVSGIILPVNPSPSFSSIGRFKQSNIYCKKILGHTIAIICFSAVKEIWDYLDSREKERLARAPPFKNFVFRVKL